MCPRNAASSSSLTGPRGSGRFAIEEELPQEISRNRLCGGQRVGCFALAQRAIRLEEGTSVLDFRRRVLAHLVQQPSQPGARLSTLARIEVGELTVQAIPAGRPAV